MFSAKMRASTKVLLGVFSVVILVGAGFGLWAWQTGKLNSSADTIFGNVIGQAYIQLDNTQIPVTNTKVTITPGSGTNPSTTFVTCAGKFVCAGNPLGSFKFTLLSLGTKTHTITADEFVYSGKTYVAQPVSNFTISAYQTTTVNLVFTEKKVATVKGNVCAEHSDDSCPPAPNSDVGLYLFKEIVAGFGITKIATTKTDINGDYIFKDIALGYSSSLLGYGGYQVMGTNEFIDGDRCYLDLTFENTKNFYLTKGEVKTVDLWLDEGAFIHGKVYDATNLAAGIPATISLYIYGISGEQQWQKNYEFQADNNGNYHQCRKTDADLKYRLDITAAGYQLFQTPEFSIPSAKSYLFNVPMVHL